MLIFDTLVTTDENGHDSTLAGDVMAVFTGKPTGESALAVANPARM